MSPRSGRSPGGGQGNPLQYSCLEKPLDRGPYWATVHRIAMTWIQLRDSMPSTQQQASSAGLTRPGGAYAEEEVGA